MKVPLLDLKAQFDPIQKDIQAAIARVFETHRYINGPEVEALEENIAKMCGTKYAIGVSSGTDAILCALMAANIGDGDEVITTPFTFFATVESIVRLGAVPVFVDIDPDTYNLDPDLIEGAITEKTKAIIPVHLFGQSCDMDPIQTIAKEKNLVVIEDAAQSLGATYKDRPVGSLGDMGCFSFFPSKNLGCCGDGGAITTDNEQYADLCKKMRSHGSAPKYHHEFWGGNFRLDAIQAAILNAKIPYFENWCQERRKNAERYNKFFADTAVETPTIEPYNTTVFNQYVVRVAENNEVRDAIRKQLNEAGIGNEVYYPEPMHLQPCMQYLGYEEGDLPESERASEEVIAIPIYPELTTEMQAYVADNVIRAVNAVQQELEAAGA